VKLFENGDDWQDAIADIHLALLGLGIRKIFGVHAKQPGACFADGRHRSTPVRAVCPISMQRPQRGSMFFTTSRTLCGVGKCLSSVP